MRHFLRDDDLSPAELIEILDLADEMKADRFLRQPLAGPRAIAVVFDKPSTRTRVSFSVGIVELGGYPLVLDAQTSQLSRGALTDAFHPCQLLADLQTVREHKGRLAGLTLTYAGDAANNMAHSYLLAGATAGMHVRVAGPAAYQPATDIVVAAQRIAAAAGGSVRATTDPDEAFDGADVVATDTWVSIGQEGERDDRSAPLEPFAVDAKAMARAAPDAIVLHCLPAYRGKEIAAEVIDGPQSV